jgi:cbb3-type cytochrome oxidase cytochrome c subunit
VLVAHCVIAGPDRGYELAKLGEEAFTNRHKITVDDYWEKVKVVAMPEYQWLKERAKYTYDELIEAMPWNS